MFQEKYENITLEKINEYYSYGYTVICEADGLVVKIIPDNNK